MGALAYETRRGLEQYVDAHTKERPVEGNFWQAKHSTEARHGMLGSCSWSQPWAEVGAGAGQRSPLPGAGATMHPLVRPACGEHPAHPWDEGAAGCISQLLKACQNSAGSCKATPSRGDCVQQHDKHSSPTEHALPPSASPCTLVSRCIPLSREEALF